MVHKRFLVGLGLVLVWIGAIAPTQANSTAQIESPQPFAFDHAVARSQPPILPSEAVWQGVEADLAERSDWEPGQGYGARQSFQTWPNLCLGLASPDEVCAAGLTAGWHIEIGLGSRERTYVYHTDLTGTVVRYFDSVHPVPAVVQDRILAAVAQAQSVVVTDLRLGAIEPHFFTSCSGFIELQNPCMDEGFLGWRSVVTDGTRQWIYHADHEAQRVIWNQPASLATSTYEPVFQFNDSVLDLGSPKVVFQSVYHSGVEGGGSVVAVLRADGSLARHLIDPDGSYEVVSQRVVSESELEGFLAVLREAGFSDLYGLDYWAPDGAEQYSYYQLNDRQGFVYFDDHSLGDLPAAIQVVLEGWNRLIHP